MTRSALARLLRRIALAAPALAAPACAIDLNDCVKPEVTVIEPTVNLLVDVDAGCNPFEMCGVGGVCSRHGVTCTFANGDGGIVAVCHFPEEHVACHRDCTGRRPAGLHEPALAAGASALGDHFAAVAHLEAASVEAFRRLRDELIPHGAPPALVRAAARAERDEVRHARITRALARRHGAEPPPVEVASPVERDLEAMAQENVTEGCVSEGFGAVIGWWQARHASTAGLRGLLHGIARDEQRHAELAFAVDAWARNRLDVAARKRLDQARAETIERVGRGLAAPIPPVVASSVGLPRPEVGAALFRMAREELWSDA